MADAALSIRPATADDARAIWEWRNDPTTRAMSGEVDVIPWEVHARRCEQALGDSARRLLMVQLADTAVGMVRFDDTGAGTWRISVNLAPAARGRGHGTAALLRACDWLVGHERPRGVTADIRTGNVASVKAFAAAGFRRVSGDGEWERYLRTFED